MEEKIEIIYKEVNIFFFLYWSGKCGICCCSNEVILCVYDGVWCYILLIILLNVLICFVFDYVWYGSCLCLEVNLWFFSFFKLC